ncbi:MAG: HAD family hydrolase [archaeon]
MKLTGIKAITFDADGTLWDFEKSMRIALHEILKEIRAYHPESSESLDIKKLIEIRENVSKEQEGKITDHIELRHLAFKETLRYIGIDDDRLASHLCENYIKCRYSVLEPYDDVKKTLDALKDKYTLGLLSNGHTSPRHCSLDHYLAFTIFSKDCGIQKPDLAIFILARQKAGCSKDELLHVGDSLEDDIAGARAAGIRCIWLNRKKIKNATGIMPDHEITSLNELLDIL